jgi:hypothetical protein
MYNPYSSTNRQHPLGKRPLSEVFTDTEEKQYRSDQCRQCYQVNSYKTLMGCDPACEKDADNCEFEQGSK